MTTLLLNTSMDYDYEEGYTKADFSIRVTSFAERGSAQKELEKQARKAYHDGINSYDPEGRPDFEYLSDENDFAQLHADDFGTIWELKDVEKDTAAIVTLTQGNLSSVLEFDAFEKAQVFFQSQKEKLKMAYPAVKNEQEDAFAGEKEIRDFADEGFAHIQVFKI